MLQGVADESQPSKLVGSRGSRNRYFDFNKLAEVCLVYMVACFYWASNEYIEMKGSCYCNLILLCSLLLGQVTALVTVNLNKIIDVNYYPIETARRSNLRHRPIGIGVQGLADAFILLGMAFDSPEVKVILLVLFSQDWAKLMRSNIYLFMYKRPSS